MNSKAIFLFISFFALSLSFGQDSIYFRNGDVSGVKVLEIDESFVRYKRHDNLDGPTFTVDKNKIKQIIYQNGTSDSFELNEPAKQANGQDIKKNEKKILITQENVLGYIMNSICNRPEAKAKRFTIEYGNKFFSDHYITVSGACNSGKKHGQFNLYDGNRLVMKTKFNNDSEVKTDCVSRPANRRIPQRFCFDAYFLQQ